MITLTATIVAFIKLCINAHKLPLKSFFALLTDFVHTIYNAQLVRTSSMLFFISKTHLNIISFYLKTIRAEESASRSISVTFLVTEWPRYDSGHQNLFIDMFLEKLLWNIHGRVNYVTRLQLWICLNIFQAHLGWGKIPTL